MSVPAQNALHGKASGPLRILVVRVGAMGDVIHALPAVAALRAALPDAHIGWAIEPRWTPLLRAEGAPSRDAQRMPLVNSVHLVEAKEWNKRPFSPRTLRSIAALRRELRAGRYDVAVDLQGTLRSAVIARMSGAPLKVGSDAPREAIARNLYRTRVPMHAVHVTDQAGELVNAALAVAGRSDVRAVFEAGGERGSESMLPRDRQAEAWWRERRAELCGDKPYVLLAATAGWGAKEWPPEKFAGLAATLVTAGYCVLLNTAPGGDRVTERVQQWVRDSAPERTHGVAVLPATLPELIAATRDATAIIAGDTGPLHLAAALSVPTVGLFGPTAPERTGPRSEETRAINLRHASSMTDHRRHAQAETGLQLLTVDEVFAAFLRVTKRD